MLSVILESLTDDRQSGDGPVPAGVVLLAGGVVPKVAVLERRERVAGAVEGGAVVAFKAVVAAGALELPPPVVVAAPFSVGFGWVVSRMRPSGRGKGA